MAIGLSNGTTSGPEAEYNALNYDVLLKILKTLLKSVDINSPAPFIPPPLVLLTSGRPGLSPRKISGNIIRRQNEAGAPSGVLPNGEESISERMERIRIEEIVNAIQLDMRITTVNTIPIVLGAPPGTAGGTGVAQ